MSERVRRAESALYPQEWLREVKADAWDEGYRTCDQVWAETADISTPDEYRTDPRNPYRLTNPAEDA